ncbi:hypothetical protein ABMA27_012548 [Loxostege sticticalis]|uniref:Uncharacterized protein n=1 Tax=Loxostege sticticalis TaxID=481309 RepID=A0ABR3GZA9_LOXSC
MAVEIKDQWYLKAVEQLDTFCKRLDDKIDKEQQQLKACKKQTELETKLAHEMKLHNELTERLAELSRRGSELDRVCASFESCLTIADSDKTRLDNAKEAYQLAKELTGIRLDFSAPPHIAKGYIKSEYHKQLHPFEIDMSSADSNALWNLLNAVVGSDKGNDENRPIN